MTPAPLLAVSGLHVTFPGDMHAVRDVGFTLVPGEVLAVVGESGAGKSATASAVVGLLPAAARTTGSVRLRGRELLGLGDKALAAVRGGEIALIGQDPAFTPVYRIGAQIAEAVRLHTRAARRAAAERAIELLGFAGVPDASRVARAYPHQLSGGLLRRAMIAMAIAADPAVILADEPTAGLDPLVRARVLNALRAVQRRTGAALLLITHDLEAAANHADRVLVLHEGRAIETAPVGEVFAHPRSPHTAALVASATRLDPQDGSAAASVAHPSEGFEKRRTAGPENRRPLAGSGGDHAREPSLRPVVLEVDGLVKHYPLVRGAFRRQAGVVRAVDGVRLDVRAGETVGLVGESGCGKTTMLLEILRLGACQDGRITVFGEDTATLSAAARRRLRRDVQLVFQNPLAALDPRMTVRATLAEPLRAHREPDIASRIPELLRLVGLAPEHAARYPGELSGGQRQRVGIARALALRPRLLLLDEPFSALDVSARAAVLALLRDLRARLGLSYLLAAHDLTAVRRLADRVAVMCHGRIAEVGAVDTVFQTPAHPCTRALLSAVPREPVDEQPDGCRFRTRCPAFSTLPAADRRRCTTEEPAVRPLDPERVIACHFPLRSPS
jgi:peptide/nickel transport system ATP-binding protein